MSEEQRGSLGYVVCQQDWYGHQSGDPRPPVDQTWFPTRDEAEAYKSKLRQQSPDADTMLLCIAPASKPRNASKRRH